MELQLPDILSQFCLLSGLDTDTSAVWLPLCASAKVWIEQRLHSHADPDRDTDRLTLAAAGIAFHRYTLLSNTTGTVKVADVSITEGSGGRSETAALLRDDLLAQVADLLVRDCGPVLMHTEGSL